MRLGGGSTGSSDAAVGPPNTAAIVSRRLRTTVGAITGFSVSGKFNVDRSFADRTTAGSKCLPLRLPLTRRLRFTGGLCKHRGRVGPSALLKQMMNHAAVGDVTLSGHYVPKSASQFASDGRRSRLRRSGMASIGAGVTPLARVECAAHVCFPVRRSVATLLRFRVKRVLPQSVSSGKTLASYEKMKEHDVEDAIDKRVHRIRHDAHQLR